MRQRYLLLAQHTISFITALHGIRQGCLLKAYMEAQKELELEYLVCRQAPPAATQPNLDGLRRRTGPMQDAPLSQAMQKKLQMHDNLQVCVCVVACNDTNQQLISGHRVI